jgi:LmbE family N-acetylglucosaminyl deacetylase
MQFNRESAEVLVPDGLAVEQALARTTHMAVAAHPDDIEIIAFDGIEKCFQREDHWFCGIVVTDGAGSPRDALYKDYSDDAMRAVRRKEQKKAALVGEYGAQVLLDYPSRTVIEGSDPNLVPELARLLSATRPEIIYTHNLADRHDTHVAVAIRLIEATRLLPAAQQPVHLYGCEVWGDLDWLVASDKVAFDVSARDNLQAALLGVFDSQISGGKRYDLATACRRTANATYFASHSVDVATRMSFAMDLTPLIRQPDYDIAAYAQAFVDRFGRDIASRIERVTRPH